MNTAGIKSEGDQLQETVSLYLNYNCLHEGKLAEKMGLRIGNQTHYTVLGLKRTATLTQDQLNATAETLRCEHYGEQEMLDKINAALECLSSDRSKAAYDKELLQPTVLSISKYYVGLKSDQERECFRAFCANYENRIEILQSLANFTVFAKKMVDGISDLQILKSWNVVDRFVCDQFDLKKPDGTDFLGIFGPMGTAKSSNYAALEVFPICGGSFDAITDNETSGNPDLVKLIKEKPALIKYCMEHFAADCSQVNRLLRRPLLVYHYVSVFVGFFFLFTNSQWFSSFFVFFSRPFVSSLHRRP